MTELLTADKGKVSIIGMGLIGGSLGMAMVGKELAGEVWGIDVDTATLELAAHTQAGHHFTTNLRQGVSGADLVIIATPVSKIEEILQAIAPHLKPGSIVTDVGSVKQKVVDAAGQLLPASVEFIGGHPMAGSEVAGIGGADRYLFENAVYVLSPTASTSPQALQVMQYLIAGIGARLVQFAPEEHDLLVAAVSHLPHLVACALVNTVGEFQNQHDQALMLAAGGFRDTTRIAASQAIMWRDIFLANDKATLALVERLQQTIDSFAQTIKERDSRKLEDMLNQARRTRQQVPAKVKGYLPPLHEIIVTVPDRPGMIGEIAILLGNQGININDIEILRVREGDGGTIRLGVASANNAERAVGILRDHKIVAKIKE